MRRRAWLGLPAAWALLPGCAVPVMDDLGQARALRDAALQDGSAERLARELAGGIGPRSAGSEGDRRATAWALTALRGLGLANVRAEPVPLRVWQRGPALARLTAPAPRPLVMAALGNSVPTPPEGLEAEIAWYPDLAALQADSSERARGRIVFIDQRTERTRDGSGYGRAVGARLAGPVEAAKRGAIALAIRSIGTDREAIAHTGATRYDLRVPRIPAFAVAVPDAEHIAALQAAGAPMRLQLLLQARSEVDAVTHNVIAEIPGSDRAGEIVLIGAHLDSWDLGQGALDNAAGVGIVGAAAGLIAAGVPRPRRTIRVVLFGNEENGFDGARRYGDGQAEVVHQLVAESDFGSGAVYRLSSRVRPEARPAIEAMAALLAPLGVELGGNEGTPGPDAALLMRRHRWPALQLHQDGRRYFDVHHTERDTVEMLDPPALRQNVACWAVCTWLAAQAPEAFGPLG